MTKYSRRMAMMHWLILILVIVAWFLGEAAHDAREEKVATLLGYIVHASVGGTILLLTLFQLFFRQRDGRPAMLADKPLYQFVAKAIHYLLYAVLLLLPLSGLLQIVMSDLGTALWTGNVAMLPKKFEGVWAHEVHEILVSVLLALTALHILGAVKHQFIMKDGLLSRMSLRKRP